MAQLWDEGRVLGLAAYEAYVKQFLSVNPNGTPLGEREWLASTLSTGTSLLIHVPGGSGTLVPSNNHYVLDIPLPAASGLRAANTIYAAFFDGEIETALVNTDFATRVSSYGQLISNTYSTHPSGTIDDPTTLSTNFNSTDEANRQGRITEYNKIVDGVFLQPGTWTDATMYSTFTPDLSKPPVLRLELTSQISSTWAYQPNIILTGFTPAGVLEGVTGVDGVVPPTDNPYDGDFLGPALFPWAAKVVFIKIPETSASSMTVTSSAISYFTPDTDPGTARLIDIEVSGTHYKALAVTKSDNTQYNIYVNPPSAINTSDYSTSDNLTWVALLEALANNYSIDILGTDLKDAKVGLPHGYLTFKKGQTNEVRLYISKTSPGVDDGNIPDGSIGIGWTS